MSESVFECPRCSRRVLTSSAIGETIPCPFCSQPVQVPRGPTVAARHISSDLPPPGPSLRLKRGTLVSGANQCPSCGAVLPDVVVVCTKCGLDLRTGKRFQIRIRKASPLRKTILLVLLGALAVAGSYVAIMGSIGTGSFLDSVTDLIRPKVLVGRHDIIMLATNFEESVTRDLETSHPSPAVGEEVVLRLGNGLVIRGTVQAMSNNCASLGTVAGPKVVSWADLDADSRLTCDPQFRESWVRAQAAVLARKDMEARGLGLPVELNVSTNLEDAVRAGDPAALRRYGEMFLSGEKAPRDVDYAFLYTLMAAVQGDAEAEYHLGCLYASGTAVGRDLSEGLRWIRRAASKHYGPAEAYLESSKGASFAKEGGCSRCGGTGWVKCPGCRGAGWTEVRRQGQTCEQCNGTGKYKKRFGGKGSSEIPCAFCKGEGRAERVVRTPCSVCGQKGFVACSGCAGRSPVSDAGEMPTTWFKSFSDDVGSFFSK